MKKLLLLLLLVSPALGQRYDNFASTVASASGIGNLMQAVPNATITVCNFPGTGGTPCTNKATTYTSQTLGTACAAATQVVLQGSSTCQATGDIFGNFGFWAPATKYTVCIGGNNVTTVCGTVTATLDAIGNNNPGVFTNTQANLYLISQVGTTAPGTFFNTVQGGFQTDGLTAIVTAPVGATAHQFNAVDGACITNAVSSPLGSLENCVSLYGYTQVAVSNAAGWGVNEAVTDVASTTGTSLNGNEVDVGVKGTPTALHGFFLTGGPLSGTLPALPTMGTVSNNMSCGFCGLFGTSTATSFPVMFYSARGASNNVGLMLDAACYTGNCSSQSIQMGGNNGSAQTATLVATQSGVLTLSNTGGTAFNVAQVIPATSAAFATATTAGTCVQNTTAVTGATTSMTVLVSPVSTPGVGAQWSAFVSSAGNITINECAVATSAGGTIAFNIRVIP